MRRGCRAQRKNSSQAAKTGAAPQSLCGFPSPVQMGEGDFSPPAWSVTPFPPLKHPLPD